MFASPVVAVRPRFPPIAQSDPPISSQRRPDGQLDERWRWSGTGQACLTIAGTDGRFPGDATEIDGTTRNPIDDRSQLPGD